MLKKADTLVTRWQEHLDACDIVIGKYQSLPADATEEDQFGLLYQAENLVSTEVTPPGSKSQLQLEQVISAKRSLFAANKDQLKSKITAPIAKLGDFYNTISSVPIKPFDAAEFDLTQEMSEVKAFNEDLIVRAEQLKLEIENRLNQCNKQIQVYNDTRDPAEKADALIKAGKILFGEDFKIIPEFSIPNDKAEEWEKAYNNFPSQISHLKSDFPVDDWLYGVARVREKMHLFEDILFLARSFGKKEPDLHPVQFPFRIDDPWLALEYPPDTKIDSERLLYTAHYSGGSFNKSNPQCGLLLDEWTETIPAKDETTGVVFNYDRPNSEPPQVLLLVTPPDTKGFWEWPDLVDALHETLKMARQRAIEPDYIEDLPYTHFLPATITAVTFFPITIALNLALGNPVALGSEGDTHE
jgi:hypothetical protein